MKKTLYIIDITYFVCFFSFEDFLNSPFYLPILVNIGEFCEDLDRLYLVGITSCFFQAWVWSMYVCVCFLCKHMHAYQYTCLWRPADDLVIIFRNTYCPQEYHSPSLETGSLFGLELMSYTGYPAEPQEFPFSTSLVLQLLVHTITLAFTWLWGIKLRSSSLLATHFTHWVSP